MQTLPPTATPATSANANASKGLELTQEHPLMTLLGQIVFDLPERVFCYNDGVWSVPPGRSDQT
jgi:hypothetical protein